MSKAADFYPTGKAEEESVSEQEVQQMGMGGMSRQFADKGGELYAKA